MDDDDGDENEEDDDDEDAYHYDHIIMKMLTHLFPAITCCYRCQQSCSEEVTGYKEHGQISSPRPKQTKKESQNGISSSMYCLIKVYLLITSQDTLNI